MKKQLLCLVLTTLVLVSATFAVGGDVADPLISLSYLQGIFTTEVTQTVEQTLDTADETLLTGLDAKINGALTATESSSTWQELQLNQGDVVYLPTGGNLQVLAGDVSVAFSSGAVVNVTQGSEVSSGNTLTRNQRYMVAEDTLATCTVTSKTAVVNQQGPYGSVSSGQTDYVAMAQSLKSLNLFQGSFTGYGNGFDLDVTPTRVQGLIMFIRVLGEEQQALAYTGTTPFVDIASGSLSEKYVGYAYAQGYTNGYSTTEFCPDLETSATQYVEFLLRAMGYSDIATSNLSNTMSIAQSVGLVTTQEAAAMETEFLRADLVYTSYYALSTPVSSGETLAQSLINQGIFTTAQYQGAQVSHQR